MSSAGSKPNSSKPPAKKPASAAPKAPAETRKAGKKPAGMPTGPPIGGKPIPLTPPVPETSEHEKPLCWIELVKSGTMFIARSSTYGAASKEYKNRVLEDMLTELIVELQEEIQE